MAFAEHHDMIEAFPADRADPDYQSPRALHRLLQRGDEAGPGLRKTLQNAPSRCHRPVCGVAL